MPLLVGNKATAALVDSDQFDDCPAAETDGLRNKRLRDPTCDRNDPEGEKVKKQDGGPYLHENPALQGKTCPYSREAHCDYHGVIRESDNPPFSPYA